jgi:hypothetical protein
LHPTLDEYVLDGVADGFIFQWFDALVLVQQMMRQLSVQSRRHGTKGSVRIPGQVARESGMISPTIPI